LPRRSAASNLPLGLLPSHRLAGDSPGPRPRPFGPGQPALAAGLWVPLALRRAAFASWAFWCPLRGGAVLAKIVRLTGPGARPQRGYRVPHPVRCGGGGRLLYCGAWVSVGRAERRSRPLARHRRVRPTLAATFRLRSLNEGSRAFALPVFPWPGSPGWLGLPLGFTRLLSHALLPGACAGREPTWTHIGAVGAQPTTAHQKRLSRRTPLRQVFARTSLPRPPGNRPGPRGPPPLPFPVPGGLATALQGL
jgi:hypothetical protein